MTVNAIAISGRLEAAGLEKKTADAVASEIVEFNEDHLATKADLAELKIKDEQLATKADLKIEIADLRAELKADIAEIKADLKALTVQVKILTILVASTCVGIALLFIDRILGP